MRVNRIYFRDRKSFLSMIGLLSLAGCAGPSAINPVVDRERADSELELPDSFRTPDWAKGLVWFQVFPERFRDSNPGNNPDGWDLTLLEWDSPFDEPSIEEIERAWNRSQVSPQRYGFGVDRDGGALPNVVYARRYGGDLQGVYEQLETIKERGFTGVYLCPIFESRSLHKYDASDHRHIDPTLGHPGRFDDPGPGHTALSSGENPFDEGTWAWTPADRWFIDVFLPKAKSLGLRVVFDGAWNHVGLDHFAFNDVRLHGSDSQFSDWFDVVFDDEGRLVGWQGWSRVNGSLPEFRHVGNDLASGPKAHIMAVTRRWMDPNGDGDPSDGVDGWRLDVAAEIGAEFWRDWRTQVKSINPDALIVAEIWGDASNVLNDKAFDAQMNYPFAYPVADWLSIGGNGVMNDASIAANRLRRVFDNGREVDLVQFNLMSSHDTERLASMMHNSWERGFDNESSRWFGRYEHSVVSERARTRSLAAIATMVASPGAVMIYNGDEFALAGADDPDNRRPIPWKELDDVHRAFADEVSSLLKLRSDPEIGVTLRLGDAVFDSIGNHTLVIRRTRDDQLIEVRIAPEKGMLSEEAVVINGWVRDHEMERKLSFDGRKSPVEVRIYQREGH